MKTAFTYKGFFCPLPPVSPTRHNQSSPFVQSSPLPEINFWLAQPEGTVWNAPALQLSPSNETNADSLIWNQSTAVAVETAAAPKISQLPQTPPTPFRLWGSYDHASRPSTCLTETPVSVSDPVTLLERSYSATFGRVGNRKPARQGPPLCCSLFSLTSFDGDSWPGSFEQSSVLLPSPRKRGKQDKL